MLSPDITALADAERSGFAGHVGAGVTDLLMNALGYVWRDNGACLTATTDPHADFIYAGGAVTGHGVVLAEAHGSFAQSVTGSRMSGEAKRKYRRQVKPHIAGICAHGKVIHGYAVAFGCNPASGDTFLHVAETKITKPQTRPKQPTPQIAAPAPGLVPTSLALAAHRANFLLLGASNIVAWIDWLRGAGERPDENAISTFFAVGIAGRRFLVAADYLLPYLLPWALIEEQEAPNFVWRRAVFERWRDWPWSGLANIFAMDKVAAKSFLLTLSGLIGSPREQIPMVLDLPDLEPAGLFTSIPDRRDDDGDARYPLVQLRDGLALLGRLPRSSPLDSRSWSPNAGSIEPKGTAHRKSRRTRKHRDETDSMKRMVVDKNMLEDPKNLGPKQPLRAWLAESKDHIAVVTDYAQLEMLKGNALKNILKSTEILAEFPKQVHILKPITTVSGLKGKKKALKKRATSGGGTRSFRKWCAARARAAAGDARFAAKIVKRGEQAPPQLAHMLADMAGFADNIRDATAAFTDEELGILRRHDPVTESIVIKILDGTMRLALKFFLLHPNGKIPPAAHDLPYSFIFRFALCALLHALHWRVRGGAEDRLAERMRNDVIDVTYAAYALCFDGLLSEDKLVREIYDNAEVMLALFTNHAPKPPHRCSNTVGANASAAAPGPT